MRTTRCLTAALTASMLLVGCGSSQSESPRAAATQITVTNCGQPVSLPSPAKRLFVNDGNLIAMVLALGAQRQVVGVSSLQRDRAPLEKRYGKAAVDALSIKAPEYPTLETVLAAKPDVMVAGWSYGWSAEKNLTPDTLKTKGIGAYTLSESCRQGAGETRGTMDPWTALRTDLTNLGQVTGRTTEAKTVIADLDRRLGALRAAPKAAKPPTVFLFDSGEKDVFSSGKFGAPQAIIDAAGGRNALSDLPDTWTSVSWERIARSKPDAFFFVDYPPQTFEQKVQALRRHPATKNLPAVREGRFLNLPYVMWTSSPLNIDAAEQGRQALQKWKLVPSAG